VVEVKKLPLSTSAEQETKMFISEEKGSLKVSASAYSLIFVHDRPFIRLFDSQDNKLAELFALSSVHPLHGRDDTPWVGSWKVEETPAEIIVSIEAGSSVWKRKEYRFHCRPNRFTYEVEVEGQGRLVEANYFGGYASASLRWGSGFFWSGQSFKCGFSPEPNSEEAFYFSPDAGAQIGLTGVPLPGRGDWFFTPPPFCFSFQVPQGWLGIGVEAHPGQNLYTEYAYRARAGCFCLMLDYEGRTSVDGIYRLPAIGFDFAEDEYSALQAHVDAIHLGGMARQSPARIQHDWWREPIFCGWGQQSYLASLDDGKAPDYSQQRLYENFLAVLEENELSPGIVVLDDKWQASYGENRADENKWPDLPGFTAWQHTLGRRVLLWLKAWDPEGVPVEECILNAAGIPVAVDPSNPAYEIRLRESVRFMLSPEGYNADGFKIDFTARIPSGPGFQLAGNVWGLELMKLYLWIIYDEARGTKSDALIMTHTPHPYLAEVTDMIRLNDINTGKDINTAMVRRARIASIACPTAIIDTDNWPVTDRESWRRYVELQPELGVPSLYYASHIDQTGEPLRPADYKLLRKVWARHRAQIQNPPAEEAPDQPQPHPQLFFRAWQELGGDKFINNWEL
jgi:hypothetical protein